MSAALADQLEIQELLYRYARAVDDRDPAALAACFADGQVWMVGPGFEMRSAAQTTEALKASFEWTMHNVHNHVHEVAGDSAKGYTYCVASHLKTEEGRRTNADWYIRYEDQLARSGGRWAFVKRELVVGLIETRVLTD